MKKIFDVNDCVKNKTGEQILSNEIAKQLMALGWSNEKISFSLQINEKVNKSKDTEEKSQQKKVQSHNFDYEITPAQKRANLKLDPHSAWGL